jgi:rhamnopyranosyl-N-acetylglucosaminyl-diphospho-decaprenol beta-1,3/1,4-galactofuranosyltransferase
MHKIAAVVVTYNRKDCLMECLDAIEQQTLPPDIIYVVDNHSTDGTFEILSIKQTESKQPGKIDIKYIYKQENSGGAGGFYTGMKTAFDDGYEWFWMMDDDGLPAPDGLEQLFFYTTKYDLYFTNALVINIQDRVSLAFRPLRKNKNSLFDYKQTVYDKIHPFNGTFINRIIPEHIGFIKKEMFLWGDEWEYVYRVEANDYTVATIAKSIHYHPAEKGNLKYCIPFIKKWRVLVKPANLADIYYRNLGYLYAKYLPDSGIAVKYIVYFIIRFKFIQCIKFIIAFNNGCKNKFVNNITDRKRA